MTREEMAQFLTGTIFPALNQVREDGQKEYAHNEENAFANFERAAARYGISREKALMIFLDKHMDGVVAHVNGHTSQREPVEGRIKDAIMYLCLLWGMVHESKQIILDSVAHPYVPNESAIGCRKCGLPENAPLHR